MNVRDGASFEPNSVVLRTVVASDDAGRNPTTLAVRIWLKPALASGDGECAMQIDGLMREPITFAGIDSMHALEIAMSAADSHLVYASRAKNLTHRWGQPYHSTSSWGARPRPPAPPPEAIAHTYWFVDPDGVGHFFRLFIKPPELLDAQEKGAAVWACHLDLLPQFNKGPAPICARDPMLALSKTMALASLLFDAYRRRGWVLMYSPQDKTPLPQTLFASAPNHDESAASAQALLDELRLSHSEMVDFIEGAARLSGKP